MGETQFDFHGAVVAITGAAGGIGKRTAESMADAGASVYLLDIDAERGEKAAAEIRAQGGEDVTFVTLACERSAILTFANFITNLCN